MSRPPPRTARSISTATSDTAAAAHEDNVDDGSLLAIAPADAAGERVDKLLARLLPDYSRSRLQQWIEAGAVRVDGEIARPRQPLHGGETIEVLPLPAAEDAAMQAEEMRLEVVHEDADIAVIDKPAGLVVHPAAGHWTGTLANGLLARFPQTAALPRAGIVHRLDADTSGLMVVALSLAAQTDLVRQLQARTVSREYWAIVYGAAPREATIEAALARDPRNPLRFAVSTAPRAKAARTHLRCLQTVSCGRTQLSWVACRLDTGRTHQIRVHLESLGMPLVGDPVYRRGRPGAADRDVEGFNRQALHACGLGLVHPARGEAMNWTRPPPQDMQDLMDACGFKPTRKAMAAFK